jgi:hypothetical protein
MLEPINARFTHIDDSLKMLRDEVRRVHVQQTCSAESAQLREISQRLFNIEEQISTFYFVKVHKKEKEESKDAMDS